MVAEMDDQIVVFPDVKKHMRNVGMGVVVEHCPQ
jgi:hypothetical protein